MVASHETSPEWITDVAVCAAKLERIFREYAPAHMQEVRQMLEDIVPHLSDDEREGMAHWGMSHLAVEVLEQMNEAKEVSE